MIQNINKEQKMYKYIQDKIKKTLKELYIIKELKFSKNEITFTSISPLTQMDIDDIKNLVLDAFEIHEINDIDVDINQDFVRTGSNYVTIEIFR